MDVASNIVQVKTIEDALLIGTKPLPIQSTCYAQPTGSMDSEKEPLQHGRNGLLGSLGSCAHGPSGGDFHGHHHAIVFMKQLMAVQDKLARVIHLVTGCQNPHACDTILGTICPWVRA